MALEGPCVLYTYLLGRRPFGPALFEGNAEHRRDSLCDSETKYHNQSNLFGRGHVDMEFCRHGGKERDCIPWGASKPSIRRDALVHRKITLISLTGSS